jgi:hypothetical protein
MLLIHTIIRRVSLVGYISQASERYLITVLQNIVLPDAVLMFSSYYCLCCGMFRIVNRKDFEKEGAIIIKDNKQ